MYDDRFFEFIYVLEFIDDLIFYYKALSAKPVIYDTITID